MSRVWYLKTLFKTLQGFTVLYRQNIIVFVRVIAKVSPPDQAINSPLVVHEPCATKYQLTWCNLNFLWEVKLIRMEVLIIRVWWYALCP